MAGDASVAVTRTTSGVIGYNSRFLPAHNN
jgi:hypothetical protein